MFCEKKNGRQRIFAIFCKTGSKRPLKLIEFFFVEIPFLILGKELYILYNWYAWEKVNFSQFGIFGNKLKSRVPKTKKVFETYLCRIRFKAPLKIKIFFNY